MNIFVDIVISFYLLALLFLSSCTQTNLTGGTSTSENGRIMGTVVNETGETTKNVRVELLPASYNPLFESMSIYVDSTDENGTYCFDSLLPGSYTIHSIDISENRGALNFNIVSSFDTSILPSDTLRAFGTMQCSFAGSSDDISQYVYIPGTTLAARIHEGAALIPHVPSGVLPAIRCISTTLENSDYVIASNTLIRADDTTVIPDIRSFKYSQEIQLNTSANGAGITETISDFAVLIRLTRENFAFDQAQPDGCDLIFTKKDQTLLRCEIERWDTQLQQAELWVNVDTIHGNSTTQSIVMHWGGPAIPASFRNTHVFDTSAGYTATWHLNSNSLDATVNGYNSTSCSAIDTIGIIGGCKKFNGTDSIVIPSLLDTQNTVTLSAWARLDSSSAGSDIISIGDAILLRMDFLKDSLGTIGSIHINDGIYYSNIMSKQFLAGSGWHLITFVFDNELKERTLLVDGSIVYKTTGASTSINYTGVGNNTIIGKHGNGKTEFGFIGCIDEVRVFRKALTPDYVRLCYMSQISNNSFVYFVK
ncbi:MAG: DUF2341 domain-containing protein [Fibrobacter sp.]|nr:DUF2341 domain-containing protein [Fibrobacter sp.]